MVVAEIWHITGGMRAKLCYHSNLGAHHAGISGETMIKDEEKVKKLALNLSAHGRFDV